MPWREICPMDEKLRFVAAVLAAEQSMTELCASFGIRPREDRIQVVDALYAAGTRRSVRSATGAASGAVGDLGATGGRDPRRAPCASELGA